MHVANFHKWTRVACHRNLESHRPHEAMVSVRNGRGLE